MMIEVTCPGVIVKIFYKFLLSSVVVATIRKDVYGRHVSHVSFVFSLFIFLLIPFKFLFLFVFFCRVFFSLLLLVVCCI